MKKKMAVIGLGNICKKAYMPVLAAHEDMALMLYNRSPEPLAEMQSLYRIDYGTSSLDKLIQDGPQGAFVLTSSDSHYEIIKRLLENGVDVFVEKPATTQSGQTRELAEMADNLGRILMVAFNRRYAPLHVQAKTLWGGIPVGMGIFRKFRSSPSYPDFRKHIYDDTIHQIDLLRFYCGDGTLLSAHHQVDGIRLISATGMIRLDSGGIALVETNLEAGGWREFYSLYGGGQSIEIEAFSNLSIKKGAEKRQWKKTYASAWKTTLSGRGFEGQISHFLTCMETRQQPQTNAWDSVKTQVLTEQFISKLES